MYKYQHTSLKDFKDYRELQIYVGKEVQAHLNELKLSNQEAGELISEILGVKPKTAAGYISNLRNGYCGTQFFIDPSPTRAAPNPAKPDPSYRLQKLSRVLDAIGVESDAPVIVRLKQAYSEFRFPSCNDEATQKNTPSLESKIARLDSEDLAVVTDLVDQILTHYK